MCDSAAGLQAVSCYTVERVGWDANGPPAAVLATDYTNVARALPTASRIVLDVELDLLAFLK